MSSSLENYSSSYCITEFLFPFGQSYWQEAAFYRAITKTTRIQRWGDLREWV